MGFGSERGIDVEFKLLGVVIGDGAVAVVAVVAVKG